MFEIRKEIVNEVGNVQHSEHTVFINCNKTDDINPLINSYYNLAKANSLYYKLRAIPNYVRYVFIYKNALNIDEAIKLVDTDIKTEVDKANNYIKIANNAYKISNSKRGIKDKSLIINEIDVKDYMWSSKCVNDRGKYVVVNWV